jgi:DNA-binding CsgD family transcriptional regulator
MLPGGYTSVMQARSRDEFRDEVIRFAQKLGFETVSAITIIDHGLGKSEFINVDNTPVDYVEPYADPSSYRRDPVMQHCKRQSVPIIWDQATYLANDAGDLWEQQAGFGYRTGIAMALHMPEGRHFLLGVDRDQPLPDDPTELQRIVADLQLFAVHAQDAAVRLLVPLALQPERPALTPRELEALRWTMEGKTAWEVGAVLGISERTAVLHVNNAMHKLGCVNKHQAVLKALRLGLIG